MKEKKEVLERVYQAFLKLSAGDPDEGVKLSWLADESKCWIAQTARALHNLADDGRIWRQQIGKVYHFQLTPVPDFTLVCVLDWKGRNVNKGSKLGRSSQSKRKTRQKHENVRNFSRYEILQDAPIPIPQFFPMPSKFIVKKKSR